MIHKVAPALIETLAGHQTALIRDVKLQHALLGKVFAICPIQTNRSTPATLGALRNLAVAPEGRPVLLEHGVLPPCLELIQGLSLTPITQPVIMKLMATLRLLVEGSKHVSQEIGETKTAVLSQIINFGLVDAGGPGPKAESGRLLAGVLKNSHSKMVCVPL